MSRRKSNRKLFKMIAEQFRLQQFRLEHPNPEDFSICCWQKSKTVKPAWIAYRTVCATYFLATVLFLGVAWLYNDDLFEEDRGKFLIFLTHWTYLFESSVFVLALCTSVRDYVKQRKESEDMKLSLLSKIFWVVYTIVLPVAMNVTMIFWIIVYTPEKFPINGPNVIVHITNSVFMVIDFLLIAFPFRFLHFYMPYIYVMVYIIFSVIYEFSGGTGVKGQRPIYTILDWEKKPASTGAYVCYLFLSVLSVHIIFSFLSLLKLWLRKKYVLVEE